jgi:hypothetical protein
MAIEISKRLLKEYKLYISWKRHPIGFIKFKIRRYIIEFFRKRELRKILANKPLVADKNNIKSGLGAGLSENSITKHADELKENHYTFVESVFDSETFNALCHTFPEKSFFSLPTTGEKFYRTSPESLYLSPRGESQFNTQFFSIHPQLESLYRFLDSAEMTGKIQKITNKTSARLYSVLASRASSGSYLAPHIDSVYNDREETDMINVIYFLLAGGAKPEVGGGTGIYEDNEFKKPVFKPNTMLNSALIYNSTHNFYHGFDLMAPGSFRWAITFQYKLE